MVINDSHGSHGESILAVDGQGIYFHFGRKKESAILNGVNIAVNRGIIYSLLGPSGCGKTTLLKCIVGQLTPQAGSLKLYGRKPGSKAFSIPGPGVGYMPQDLALYMEMTIEEILVYFGTLYGMVMKNVKERIAFLLDLLDLPDKSRLIQNLSGGQQRRVSFAVALVHKPPLNILDEPTVGVDPLLRKTIWDHLVRLSTNEHLTIIITTHYTEEARQAHSVGLMRNGRLLVENNPEDLMQVCGVPSLEEVFLRLCQTNHSQNDNLRTNPDELTTVRSLSLKSSSTHNRILDKAITGEQYANARKFGNGCDASFDEKNDIHENRIALLPLSSTSTEFDHSSFISTKPGMRIFYLTRKNFLRLKRNVALMNFTICVSSFQVIIFFLCLSSDPFDLQVAVANEEKEGLNKYGERFLLSLNNRTIYKKRFDNITLAYESLERGESWATLHIHPEFSDCLNDRIFGGVDASNDTVLCSTIKLSVDTSNYIIFGTIERSLYDSYQVFVAGLMESLGKNPTTGEMPMQIQKYSRHSKTAPFVEFATPALIIAISFVMSIGLTQMSMIAERKHGLLGRTLVAGATTTEVLLSFFFALLFLLFLQIALMLVVTFCIFSNPCNGPVFWFTVAATLSGLCGMSYGFLISAVTDDENAAALIGFGSFFPVALLSGMFWPVEAMPYYVRYISYSLPLTRLIESSRSIMTRGWDITHRNVWDGYLICSFWTVAYMMLSIILLKIRK